MNFTVERYRQLASQMNIGVPPKVYITAIWGKDFSICSGCAPMAHYMTTTPSFVPNFLQPLLQTTINLALPFAKLLPDIIIPASKGFNKDYILATTLHEYTHAAHAHLAGAGFWTNVLAGEIANMINHGRPYGYRMPAAIASAPEVGVAEAWAECIENYMMYLLTGADIYLNHIENHYQNPDHASEISDWVPSGLYFDLWDSNGSLPVLEDPSKNVMDEVDGITWGIMYRNLLGIHNFNAYKNKLILLYPAKRQTIETLFYSYSY